MFEGKEVFSFTVDGMLVEVNRKNDNNFLTYTDAEGKKIRSRIPKETLNVYINARETERKEEQIYSRYIEHYKLTEKDLYRISILQESVEDKVINKNVKKEIYKAFNKLSKKEKKRLFLFFNRKIKKMEIARQEGLTIRGLRKSVMDSVKKIKKISNF